MRWAVEYELPGGSIGLCIFTAEDLQAAQIYIEKMQTHYGHDHVFNLNELAPGIRVTNNLKFAITYRFNIFNVW